MSERGARRGAGAPFYAPPRRKTSAEIISEARAAVYGEMSGASSGAGGPGGMLRPLRTRRPYTPREPQRALFTDRARKKDTRPPSAFDLKYLSLSEDSEETLTAMDARMANLDEEALNEMLNETHHIRKKPPTRNQLPRSNPTIVERSGDGWGGFPKLPHLSGRSKPLHRRNTTGNSHDEPKTDLDLAKAISVTKPFGDADSDLVNVHSVTVDMQGTKSISPEYGTKRKQFAGNKSVSCDDGPLGNIAVRHLAVQLPSTSDKYFESMTTLELAEALSQTSQDIDRILALLEALIKAVEATNPSGSLREMVLRSLYTQVDCEDGGVLVAVARAMLTMRVTGTHLAAACKLVFKIAKNDKNDIHFKNTNLLELVVEGCGRAEPVSESECCVYGCGALRVLALEPRLAARARRAGALHLAALHLKILNNAKAESPRSVDDRCTHALFQVTGALRSLAGGVGEANAHVQEFLSSGALHELVAALSLHTDRDVLTNVARCLSVLSAEESCCAWLCSSPSSARALLRALAACAARAPLTVRLAYTLGNMAAADERGRHNIYNEEGGIDVLLTILETYTKRFHHEARDLESDPDLHLVGTDLGGSDGSNEDVLIKTVRVVANLCLAERAGRGLAASYADRAVRALLACLELAEISTEVRCLSEEDRGSIFERREELATAALATLNNITFYREPPEPPDPLDEPLDNIAKATCRWLNGLGAASCEAVRALGNVSRAPRAAQIIVMEGALDKLLPFLEHEEGVVRCAAAGVLVNVCGAGVDCGTAAALAARALGSAAARADARAAALLARALWNAHAHDDVPLTHAHAQHVAAALNSFIDDESVFAACEASRSGDRCNETTISKHHVKFNIDNSYPSEHEIYEPKSRSSSFEHIDGDVTAWSGDDLGFEDGDLAEEECECGPCKRLTAWEELVGVAIPLMEKLRPARADASVGTE